MTIIQMIHINFMDNIDLSQGPSQKYQRYNLYFCAGHIKGTTFISVQDNMSFSSHWTGNMAQKNL